MPKIQLYELGPTRSARCRWALLEAGLEFESLGNDISILGSDELRRVHPLGKLPAAIIDGRPLFESTAIVTTIADLVPERELVGRPGTWARALHDQWTAFALSELEAWAWGAMLNSNDFLMPKEELVPAIIPQQEKLFRKAAAVVEDALDGTDYLIEDRFTAADINMAYALNFGRNRGWLDGLATLGSYLGRLAERPHYTLDAMR